jgi:hypothetical protein
MLVRSTCGGTDHITPEFEAQFQDLDLSLDENDHSPELAAASTEEAAVPV